MPQLPDGTQLTPDEAIAQDKCPECAADLTKCHAASHFNTHWTGPMQIIRETEEARRRIKLCTDYLKAHPEPAAKEQA